MRERDVEDYWRECARAHGGDTFKWVSPGYTGVPDQIAMLPLAVPRLTRTRFVFPELKRPGGPVRPRQVRVHAHLRELGADVRLLDTPELIDAFFEAFRRGH